MTRRRPGEPAVHSVTDAKTSHSDDLNARVNRYLLSMAVRTVCVVLAVVVDGWLRWVFIVGAVGLPYIAVLRANNSRSPRPQDMTTAGPPPRSAVAPPGGPQVQGAQPPPWPEGTRPADQFVRDRQAGSHPPRGGT